MKKLFIIFILFTILFTACSDNDGSLNVVQKDNQMNDLSKTNALRLDQETNSYLISLSPSIVNIENAKIKLTFYLHRSQHIGIAIYNSPPSQMRKMVLGDSLVVSGYHTYEINANNLEPNKFYWVKLATEGDNSFVGRDFLTQFYFKGNESD